MLRAADYAGWDPFDGLNGARVPQWLSNSARGRQLVIQAVKRSPVDLHRLLRVPPMASADTLGHALTTCARLADSTQNDLAEEAKRLVSRLVDGANSSYPGLSWGCHFDVQTRFFFYDKQTSNAVTTVQVANGLLAATQAGVRDCRAELLRVCAFLTDGLPEIGDDEESCFGYLPSVESSIHNASMLVSGILARVGELTDHAALIEKAMRGARYTIHRQHEDGSWYYSEDLRGRWVDGFHTGFVLDGLQAVWEVTRDEAVGKALDSGLSFYTSRLLDSDGAPRSTVERAFPRDVLGAAQSIETMAWACRRNAAYGAVLDRVLEWAFENAIGADGSVAFAVRKASTDWRQYPRWTVAPMASALAAAASTQAQRGMTGGGSTSAALRDRRTQ